MFEPAVNPYSLSTPEQAGGWNVHGANGPSRPDYTLYSVGSVTLATVLGSLLAGGILMAINYRRLGQGTAAIHALLGSAVATVTIIAVGMLIPDEAHIPNSVFLVPQIVGMYGLAKSLQGPAIEVHQGGGGSLASPWKAAGIGIFTAVVVLGILWAMPLDPEL